MPSDPVPILALATAIAWISLVTVEFYERIYRERIDKNRNLLKRLGESELKKLPREIETAATEGRSPDSKVVEKRHENVRSLLRAQEDLAGKRKTTFILLFCLSITSVAASYAPTWVIVGTGQWPLTLLVIDYFLLVIIFLSGFWFLEKMFWFDEQIRVIKDLGPLQLLCGKCRVPMNLESTVGQWRCPSCGEKAQYPLYYPVG